MKITLMYRVVEKFSEKVKLDCQTEDITRWCIVNAIMDGSETSKNALFNRAANMARWGIEHRIFGLFPSRHAMSEFWSNHNFDWCVVEE